MTWLRVTTRTVRRSGSTFPVLDLMQPLQQVTPGFVMHVCSHTAVQRHILYIILLLYCIDTYLFIVWKEIIRNVYLLLLLHKELHYLHFYLYPLLHCYCLLYL